MVGEAITGATIAFHIIWLAVTALALSFTYIRIMISL